MKRLLLLLLLIALAASTASAELRAWYKFDETSGTTVTDSSGNGFNATATGIVGQSWDSEGAFGGCLNNYITNNNLFIPVSSNVFSTMDQQGSFTFWVKPMQPTATGGLYTGGWFTGTNAGGTKIAVARGYQFDNYTRFSSFFGAGSNATDWWGGYNDLVKDKWNHFAVVFDGIDGTRKVYCNGGLIIDSNTVAGDTLAGIEAFNIFSAASTGAALWDSFHGKMDDFRIYDNALTAQDVAGFSNGYFEIAKIPQPADGSIVALGEGETLTLQWQAGLYAASHDVYLGTYFDDVNDATTASAEYIGNQIATEYSPTLPSGTYYWRVDEVNGVDVYKGEVWSFDFRIANIDGALLWYKFDAASTVAVDSSGNGFDAAINGITSQTWDSEGAYGGCLNNHFANSNLYIPVPATVFSTIDKQATFAFWAQLTELSDAGLQCGGFFAGANAGGTNLAYARPYKQGTGVYPNITFHGNLGTSTPYVWWSNFDVTLGARDEWGHIAWVFDAEAGIKNLYVNGHLISAYSTNAVLPTDSLAGMQIFNVFSASSATTPSSWDSFHGKMDDFRIYPRSFTGQEVSMLIGDYFKYAKRPSPADGTEDVALDALTLSWEPGEGAVSHQVYFSYDRIEVKNADVNSACYQGEQTGTTLDVGALSLMKTYYWRVDEVDDEGTVWKGDVWSFSSSPCIMVEDFESYDDEGNDVTAVWVDALDYSDMQRLLATDSGYPVLSPVNSLRLRYHALQWSPAPFYSIASRTFSPAQDWTEGGVKMLTINYYGDAGNLGLPMFITVGDGTTDANVVVDVNTLAMEWNQINIALPEIAAAGVDLTNVTYMEIGFGDGTDQGMSSSQYDIIYIDDIALYPPKCVLSESSLTADITQDCVVNYDDLAYVTEGWLRGSSADAIAAAGPVGLWLFDDAANLTKATIGKNMTVGNYDGTGLPLSAAAGITAGDGAVLVPLSTYLIVDPNFAPAPGETRINEFTMVWDVKIPAASAYGPLKWVGLCEFDTVDLTTDVDISVIYRRSSIDYVDGLFGTHQGWSAPLVTPDKWYQLAVSVKNGEFFRCYVNGEFAVETASQAVDGRYSIGNAFHIFKDNDNEDPDINCSTFALFDRALTAAEIRSLVPVQMVKGDLNADTAIDFADYSILANEWLVEDLWP